MYSKASILALFVLTIFVARGAWKVHEKALIARTERDESVHALAGIRDRNATLEASLLRLRSGEGIEDEVRQKFSVAGPGEEVVVVVDENDKKGKNRDEALPRSWWQRLISFFTGT